MSRLGDGLSDGHISRNRISGKVILGLDHYCYWLGTPIGAHNRKAFVLFVAYSALFLVIGAAHSLHELTRDLPERVGVPPFPWAPQQAVPWRRAAAGGGMVPAVGRGPALPVRDREGVEHPELRVYIASRGC